MRETRGGGRGGRDKENTIIITAVEPLISECFSLPLLGCLSLLLSFCSWVTRHLGYIIYVPVHVRNSDKLSGRNSYYSMDLGLWMGEKQSSGCNVRCGWWQLVLQPPFIFCPSSEEVTGFSVIIITPGGAYSVYISNDHPKGDKQETLQLEEEKKEVSLRTCTCRQFRSSQRLGKTFHDKQGRFGSGCCWCGEAESGLSRTGACCVVALESLCCFLWLSLSRKQR